MNKLETLQYKVDLTQDTHMKMTEMFKSVTFVTVREMTTTIPTGVAQAAANGEKKVVRDITLGNS